MANGKVEVYSNTLSGPDFSDDKSNFVVIRDSDGKPIIVVVRLTGDTWGMCNASDNDWQNVLDRYGIK